LWITTRKSSVRCQKHPAAPATNLNTDLMSVFLYLKFRCLVVNNPKVVGSLSKTPSGSCNQLKRRLDVGFYVSEIQTSCCQQPESWRFAVKGTASEGIAALLLRLNSF
jgi:hypothetical protein